MRLSVGLTVFRKKKKSLLSARTVSKNGEPVLLSLREKLGDDPAKPAYIKTVYKVGNLLEAKG